MFKVIILSLILWPKFGYSAKLALTPPMGWNSWNTFNCNINEKLIREAADALVSSGMKDVGYEYVNIDDCWQVGRNPDGTIQVDKERFPSGMKALADYIHSRGLKFGIYSDGGYKTCAGRPGSLNYEFIDAKTYAEWGVDFLKYDYCFSKSPNDLGHPNSPEEYTRKIYQTMATAIRESGREMVFSLCSWGEGKPWKWGSEIGNLWRTTLDILPRWKIWTRNLDQQIGLEEYAGPGHWNDPDMLVVGMIPPNEGRAHFSLWALVSAPLIAGNDIRNMSKETLEILTNREVLAVNQDPMGIQGTRYIKNNRKEVWAKPLSDGTWAVILFNRNLLPRKISFKWSDLKLDWEKAQVRDLWKKQNLGIFKESFETKVGGRSAVMLKISNLENK